MNAFCQFRSPFIHDSSDIPTHHVKAYVDAALHLLTADAKRPLPHFDCGEIAHWDQGSGGCPHPNFSDPRDTVPVRFWKSQDELKPPLALVHMSRRLAANRSGDELLHIGDIDAKAGNLLPVDIDGQIGLAGDLLDFDVLHARDLLQELGNFFSLGQQHAKVVSEQLDCTFRPDTRNQFVHPLLNRLTHQDRDAWDFRQLSTDGISQL